MGFELPILILIIIIVGYFRPKYVVFGTLGMAAALVTFSEVSFLSIKNPEVVAGEAHAIDGDTLTVADRRIRIFGIEACEKGQPAIYQNVTFDCGAAALGVMQGLVQNRSIVCTQKSTDDYGRLVAICKVDGSDVGLQMLREGYASTYWYRGMPASFKYLYHEMMARIHGVGLHYASFQDPYHYRKLRN